MQIEIVFSFVLYSLVLLIIGFVSHRKARSSHDFHMGGRNINYWITAISTHASDMSSWLFLGLPLAVFLRGSKETWVACGLVIGMWLNWQFVAPKIRFLSEKFSSKTLPDFLSSVSQESLGYVRILSSLICLFFFLFYIASGLKGISILAHSLFGINTHFSLFLSVFIISSYACLGGFIAISFTDAFQGIFLLLVIVIVAVSFFWVTDIEASKNLFFLFPKINLFSFKQDSLLEDSPIIIALGWGLGYFGMPHILNKFMTIDSVKNIKKSQYLGFFWQVLALGSSVLIGFTARYYFQGRNFVEDELFIIIVKELFSPFWGGFVFCAILAATISTIDSQIIISSTIIVNDLFKIQEGKYSILVSRFCIFIVSICSATIAFFSEDSLYSIVQYAWSGQGSTFGPLVLFVLYFKKVSSKYAILSMLTGAITAGVWPYFSFPLRGFPLIPGFFCACLPLFFYYAKNMAIKKTSLK